MGTHPISESDFDCLTDFRCEMRQLLAAPFCLRSSLRRVAYRQDMPPPGGYPQMPWRRNIPQRGFGFIGVLVSIYTYYHTQKVGDQRLIQNIRESYLESQNQEMAMMPLFEAEIDRDEMRCMKEQIEGKRSTLSPPDSTSTGSAVDTE